MYPDLIAISDSDQEDCGVALISGSTRPATSRHGKSKLEPCDSGLARTTDTGIVQRPARHQLHEVIVIDCDELSQTPSSKRVKTRIQVDPVTPPPVESDENEARERFTRTIPKVVHGSATELGHVPLRSNKKQKDFNWVTARRLRQKLEHSEFVMRNKQNHLRVNLSIGFELSPVTAYFWMAGGAINKIIQQPGYIAISSATLGGQPNNPGAIAQPLDSYNCAGTLQVWKDDNLKGQSTILHGHCIMDSSPTSEGLEQCQKCYSVNNISFDPNQSHIMASTGNNGAVQLWQDGKKLANGCYKYSRAPYDVAYRERDSLMAVTCMNGCVYVHPTSSYCTLEDPMELCVGPPEVQHSVGAIAWGKGASADTLFASSESQSTTDFSGYHVAFDPDQGRHAYKFSAQESGDAMALDPEGARLALCTAFHDGAHFLRLYDVRRKEGQHPLQTIQLDRFFAGTASGSSSSSPQLESSDGEVRAVSFSPDGVLLAIARSDDELHIYDSRFMGRSQEPMGRFRHWGDDYCLGADRWGIVDAVWVDGWCGKGLGVITGGSDGCVRFWDIRRSADDILNGEVLARPDSDIGHFSVGDPYNGEKPLVVGDNGGRIYVYDHATAGSSTY